MMALLGLQNFDIGRGRKMLMRIDGAWSAGRWLSRQSATGKKGRLSRRPLSR